MGATLDRLPGSYVIYATFFPFLNDVDRGGRGLRTPVQAVIPGAQGRVLAVLAQTTAPLNLSMNRASDVRRCFTVMSAVARSRPSDSPYDSSGDATLGRGRGLG